MSKVKIEGHASGSGTLTIQAPDTSSSRTITLPDETGTVSLGVGIDDNADATAITIDSSENVGIGVTPETWENGWTGLQVGGIGAAYASTSASAGSEIALSLNTYINSGGQTSYIITDEASRYRQDSGIHYFQVAASGSADAAISFNTAMTIDNDGIVTKPLQPAFNIGKSVVQTGVTENETIIWDTEIFDIGSNFASNTFTAPVTGKYLMCAEVRWAGLPADAYYSCIDLVTSNRTYGYVGMIAHTGFDATQNYQTANFIAVVDMDASDTAYVRAKPPGAGADTANISPDSSFFSGALIA